MQAFALPVRIRSRLSATAVYLSCPEGKPESRNPPGTLSKKGGAAAAAAPYRACNVYTSPYFFGMCSYVGVKRVQGGKVRGQTRGGEIKE